MSEDPKDYEDELERPSKSQQKRESAALQDLAAELADLSRSELTGLSLPEPLFNAVCEASGMPPKGARKRMLKYIGGMLRKMDVEPVREKLAKLRNQSVHSAREHHKIERWRDRLMSEDDQALTALLSEYPNADRQKLRQLIRNAKKEAETQKPPKSSRQLFRILRELFEQP